MAYALASLSVSENGPTEFNLLDRIITISRDEHLANKLRTQMHKRFPVYASEQSIKQAQEILRMAIPNACFD